MIHKKELLKILRQENEFVENLLIRCNVPDSIEENLDDYLTNDAGGNGGVCGSSKAGKPQFGKGKAATSVEELEQRMRNIKNKLQSNHKGDGTRADKIRKKKEAKLEKTLKNLEAKQKVPIISAGKSQKNAQRKLGNKTNVDESQDNGESKGDVKEKIKFQEGLNQSNVFNPQSKLVYSKFDFLGRKKNSNQNPVDALRKLKEADKTISQLKEQGELEKAAELKSKMAWKNAFEKIEGKKVKDDRKLLYKAIKARKMAKKKSKTQWREREKHVEQDIKNRQKKRQDNINKRIKDKRTHKLKKAAKRGRIIPGF